MRTHDVTAFFILLILTLFLAGISLKPSAAGLLPEETTQRTEPQTRSLLLKHLAARPLHFEDNQGQSNERVKFLSRAPGYSLFITKDGLVISLTNQHSLISAVIHMSLIGSTPPQGIQGLNKLPARINYFIGNDPNRWHTDIHTYEKVHYQGVYPGIDLIYYGRQGNLEYDLVVAPGADYTQITMAFEGMDRLEITRSGDLSLHTASGELMLKKPRIYQRRNGETVPIAGGYLLHDTRQVRLTVSAYDPTIPLIIDPVLSYSTYLGGSGFDYGSGIAVDSDGCSYVTGVTDSTNFPTKNAYQGTKKVYADAFVSKFSSSGALIYSTYLGGSDGDGGEGIAVDSYGCAYVTGDTLSTDFPTKNAYQGTKKPSSGFDAFVTKLSPSGNSLAYSTYLGGSDIDHGYGIAVGSDRSAYVTGYTESIDFPTEHAYQGDQGAHDAFVTKLSPSGNSLAYSTYLGGSDIDHGYGIAVGSDSSAYVTGYTESTDFPTQNPYQGSHGDGGAYADAFVTKIRAANVHPGILMLLLDDD